MTTTSSTALAPTDPKTVVPPVRPGVVRRDGLIRRLLEAGDTRIVSVVAPAGYGKSTVLAQWAAEDPRPFAWITLDQRDDDPVVLLRSVLASLERQQVTEATAALARAGRVRSWSSLLPDVVAAVSSSDRPYVLVFDDVHLLSGQSLDVLGTLVRTVPDGVQLVLSGRREIIPLVARGRARGDVLELGASDLALTDEEAVALVRASGLEVTEDTVAELRRRTEGWAAGLYLAVLAARASGALPLVDASVDRFVEDYLRTEHLAHVPKRQLSFLARSSVFDRMCAELCDAVLERRDSRRVIETIEQSNLFLVPLDHERRWFRYHELFRAALRRELDRVDPGAAETLWLRAADWCEANALPEDAMAYAVASGDTDRMARLLESLSFPLYRSGRMATLEPWFERFDDGALLARYPMVGVLGALLHALRGRTFQAERWIDAAARAADTSGPLADGSPSIRPWLAGVEAILCRHGPERMGADAAIAVAELGPLSPFRPPAMWLHATARLLQGDAAGADAELEHAVEAAAAAGASFAGITAVAQRALLALGRDDVALARALIDGADDFVRDVPYEDYMPMALVLVAHARTDIREGDTGRALQHLASAQRLRPYLAPAIPFLGVQTLVEMARAYLALGAVNDAEAALFDAREVLRHRPDLGVLRDDVEDVRRQVAASKHGDLGRSPGLTAAELRLLPLLTTHLTFREIGERLFVSRNTVKTEAISIYRKLGATSRGEAVRRAAELGLVEPTIAEMPRITPSA